MARVNITDPSWEVVDFNGTFTGDGLALQRQAFANKPTRWMVRLGAEVLFEGSRDETRAFFAGACGFAIAVQQRLRGGVP